MEPDIRDDGRAVGVSNYVAGPILTRAVECCPERVLYQAKLVTVVSICNPHFANYGPVGICRTWVDPSLDCKLCREAQAAGIWHNHSAVGAVKTERLPRLPIGERRPAGQGAIVGARNVIGITFARPPTDQSSGRSRAGWGRDNRQHGIRAGYHPQRIADDDQVAARLTRLHV